MRNGLLFSMAGVAVLGALGWGRAQGTAQAGAQPGRTVLVELFTSEGCSSCPPADALLASINGRQVAGARVIGLSEHVTYWNGLGWSDPYSSDAFTARQNGYGTRFRLDSVYTPQMVVNGRAQVVGSDIGAVESALGRASTQAQTLHLKVLESSVAQDTLTLRFSAQDAHWGKPLVLVAVVTDDADRSHVLRGENSGRLLAHVDVARALLRVAVLRGDTEQTVKLPLPASALENRATGHHLVLFAQTGYGPVSGAAIAPLSL